MHQRILNTAGTASPPTRLGGLSPRLEGIDLVRAERSNGGTFVGVFYVPMFMGFFYPDASIGRARGESQGPMPPSLFRQDEPEIKAYRDASPTTHVTRDDAPFLLMHGDADVVVPLQQSEIMEQKLTAVGVPARLIRVLGGRHGPDFLFLGPRANDPRRPDDFGEARRWFDQYLKATP